MGANLPDKSIKLAPTAPIDICTRSGSAVVEISHSSSQSLQQPQWGFRWTAEKHQWSGKQTRQVKQRKQFLRAAGEGALEGESTEGSQATDAGGSMKLMCILVLRCSCKAMPHTTCRCSCFWPDWQEIGFQQCQATRVFI